MDIHDRLTLLSGQTGGEGEETLVHHRWWRARSVEMHRIGAVTLAIGVERHVEADLATTPHLVGDLTEVAAGTKGKLHCFHSELAQV